MNFGLFIKKARNEKGLSAEKLGKSAGISQTHVLLIEKSKRKPTFEVVSKLINALEVHWHELLSVTGYIENKLDKSGFLTNRKIPVLSLVNAGSFLQNDITNTCNEECIEVDHQGRRIFAVKVSNDSMEPEFIDGDIVIVNPDRKEKINDFVIATNDEYESTLKQLKKYGKTYVLHPLNSKYEDIIMNKNKHRIIGVVVEKKKYY